MMQTQSGTYVAVADFDRVKREAVSANTVLAEAVERACTLMKQVGSEGRPAAEAEKELRDAVTASQVAARMTCNDG